MLKDFKLELAEIIRDSLHNTVISEADELANNLYFDRLKIFIATLEGSTKYAYMDEIVAPDKKYQWISVKKFYSLSKDMQDKLSSMCIYKKRSNNYSWHRRQY